MKNQANDMSALFLYCRHQKNLSQRAIATLLRVNQSTICRIECGVIVPRQRTVRKLEKLMQVSVKELLPLALEAKSIQQNTEKVVKENPVKDNVLNYKHLSVSDLDYLKSKWYVLIAEAKTTLRRKTRQWRKTSKKHLLNQLVNQTIDEQIKHQQQLLDYLDKTNLSENAVKGQHQQMNALKFAKKHHQRRSPVLTSVELFMQKVALEEMEVIKQFRMKKMRELVCS